MRHTCMPVHERCRHHTRTCLDLQEDVPLRSTCRFRGQRECCGGGEGRRRACRLHLQLPCHEEAQVMAQFSATSAQAYSGLLLLDQCPDVCDAGSTQCACCSTTSAMA